MDLPSIRRAIETSQARLVELGIDRIKPFALRGLSQKYYHKDPGNLFGVDPSRGNKLHMIGIHPRSFIFEIAERNGWLIPTSKDIHSISRAQREKISNEFVQRLYNTFTSQIMPLVKSKPGLEDGIVVVVLRGFMLPNFNEAVTHSGNLQFDFSSPEKAISLVQMGPDKYHAWYSQGYASVEAVKSRHEAFTARLNKKERDQIAKFADHYLDADVKEYLISIGNKWDQPTRDFLRPLLLRRYTAYYLYAKFIDWLVRDLQKQIGSKGGGKNMLGKASRLPVGELVEVNEQLFVAASSGKNPMVSIKPYSNPTDVGGVNFDYGNLDLKVEGEDNYKSQITDYKLPNGFTLNEGEYITGLKPGTIELKPLASVNAFFETSLR